MIKKIAIIGAGYAGISALIHLKNSQISIIETKPNLGGRAFSYLDKHTNITKDNGQHLLMTCYLETLNVYKKLNLLNKLKIYKRMAITYKSESHGYYTFRSNFLPAPLHILYSFLFDLKPLSIWEKIRLINACLKLLLNNSVSNKTMSLDLWLKKNKQTKNLVHYIWYPIAVSVFNDSLKNISTYDFIHVFRILFFKKNSNCFPIIARVPLSDLLTDSVKTFCLQENHTLLLNQTVKKINTVNKKFNIECINETFSNFDFVLLACPFETSQKLLNNSLNYQMQSNSILSIHFNYQENLFDYDFIGTPDSFIHWIFNKRHFYLDKRKEYSITISDANRFKVMNKVVIVQLILDELVKIFPNIKIKEVTNITIIHEKKATLANTLENQKYRMGIPSVQDNIYICGDWTNTGYPSTIEGACKSGHDLADLINTL